MAKIQLNGKKLKINENLSINDLLKKYKNNFKKSDIIIFSAHSDKYEVSNDITKYYKL